MLNQDWVLLTKLPDLIMRSALVARLGEAQLEVYTPDRDVIVNVSSEPNLSLEGYSALFDGYEVYVLRRNLSEAQDILKKFEELAWSSASEPIEEDHTRRFYFAAMMSWMLPGILHLVALYQLLQALRKGQRWSKAKFLFSACVLCVSAFVVIQALLKWWF